MNDKNKKTILLVEDEVIIAMSESIDLKKFGYKVITANSGEEAIKVFKDNINIELILMDIDLGNGLDGTETANLILKERIIPVVFLSSHTEFEVVEKTEKITSYGYVVKNTGITVLDASIKMAFKLFESNKNIIESEIRYRRLFETAQDGIIILDAETGMIMDINPFLVKLIGYSHETFLGKTIWDIGFLKDIIKNKEKFLELQKEGYIRYEDLPLETAKGNSINVEFVSNSYFTNHKKIIQCNIRDITERTKKENALIESEQDFRKLFEEHSAVKLIIDPETGNIFNANIAASKYYGWPLEELRKMNIMQINTSSHEDVLVTLKKAEDHKDIIFETSHKMADGTIRNVAVFTNTIKMAGKEYLHEVIIDITEQKTAENNLKNSEKKYRTVVEQASDAIFVINNKGQYVEVNNVACIMLGYSREELLNLTINDISNPAENISILNEIYKGLTVLHELILIRKDGSFITVEMNAKMLPDDRIQGICRDITERKQMEKSLKESEVRFRRLFENAPIGVFYATVPGKVIMLNNEYARIMGYDTPEELKEKINNSSIESSIYFDQNERTRILKKAGEKPGDWVKSEIIYRRKDGTGIFANLHIRILPDNTDQLEGFVEDISERKKEEEIIKSLLTEKELLFKEVHHRIKNNMNTIKGLLSLQADTLKEPSAIEALNDAGNRVQSILLLYNKLNYSDFHLEVSIKEYLPVLVNEIVANFPNSKSVKLDIKADDFMLKPKVVQPLGLIINELLTNIMKYAFKGVNNGLIKVSVLLKDYLVKVIVEDNGIGMLESVGFDNSPGFGLKLVAMMVQQIDGTIRAERGNGTKIILEFEK